MNRTLPPFLLSGIPALQRLLTGPAWKVFLVLAIPGTLLVLLSIPLGVGSLPATHLATGLEQNLGYLFRHNWTWPYVVVVPVSLLLLRRLSSDIEEAAIDLENVGVLVPTERAAGRSFRDRFQHRLEGTAWITVAVAASATVTFHLFDMMDLFRGYYAFATSAAASCPAAFSEVDWSVAFATSCVSDVAVAPAFDPPSLAVNGAFVALAYAMQAAMIFLYLVWFIRLTQFFFFLSGSLTGHEFTVVPIYEDPMRRLGLGALGSIYNTFLTLILTFEVYVAAHRMQQIALLTGVSFRAYLQTLIDAASDPSGWLDPSLHHFGSIDAGTGVLMGAVAFPITLICWFPLFRLRAYIGRRRLELSKEFLVRRRKARDDGDQAEDARLAEQVAILAESNIWPNGDGTAQHFITAMVVIWLGAIFPIVFVTVALGAFGALEAVRFATWAWKEWRPANRGEA